ncbi:hypothetical protein [Isoptericola sp. NPDC057559]|uniref:hypothetical protein n=1 Tax=Isoptericola sp. NPDC057559 TaxID=3346168 RepID=UPI0036B96A23
MQITLSGVRVEGRREPMLEATDLAWSAGECLLVAGEPGHGHTALALVATGRFAPSDGAVRLDGNVVPASVLRARTAVVDVPGISEPDDALSLADVVAEGLALAGRRSLPRDVTRWLEERSLTEERGKRVDQLSGAVRTAVLAALAAENPDVRFVVLTLPDRHGGEPTGWWETARTLAAAGLGVLVQCTRSSARELGADLPPARGQSMHEPPRVVLRETPGAAPEAPAPSGDETVALPVAAPLPEATAVLPAVATEPEPEAEREPEPEAVPEEEVEDELEPSPDPDPRAEEDLEDTVPVVGRHHHEGPPDDVPTDVPTDVQDARQADQAPTDETQEEAR